jgi:hypothetical protein
MANIGSGKILLYGGCCYYTETWLYTSADVPCTITADAGADQNLYFGYSAEQCATRTAVVTGGTAPYTYNWSLNRSLLLNVENDAGDETMTGASTATVTICLLDTATLTLTVTDASGCTATDNAIIYGEDVRCFKGNAVKVTICHSTGNTKTPWTKICVDDNAVDAHLAHGDYLGACLTIRSAASNPISSEFSIYPNPTSGFIIIELTREDQATIPAEVSIMNAIGIEVYRNNTIIADGTLKQEVNLESSLPSGIYFVRVIAGEGVYFRQVIYQK